MSYTFNPFISTFDNIGSPKTTLLPTSSLGKLVAIGDSWTAFHNVGSASYPGWQNAHSQRGYINWFFYLTGNPFDYNTHYVGSIAPYFGCNAGIAGEQSKDALARFDHDVRQQDPAVIVIEEGGNDVANGQTQATIFANIKKLIDLAMSVPSCRQVIVLSIPPRVAPGNYTTGQETIRKATNIQIAQYCALFPTGVAFFNLDTLLIDPATGFFNTLYCLSDGVHPNPWGSYLIAQTYFVPWFKQLGGNVPILRALPDPYNASNQPYGNLLPNMLFTGTGGTMSGTVTGTVASNWRLSLDIGTATTAVASIVTGTDWNGTSNTNYQQAVFTTNGTGSSELMNLKPTINITTGIITGNYYVAEVEVIITGYTGATSPLTSVFVALNDTSDAGNVQAFITPSSASDTWPQLAPIRLVLRTPPLRASATTGFTLGLYARLNAALTGTATVQWAEPVLRIVPQPKMKYLEGNSVATISGTSNVVVGANNRTYEIKQGTPTSIMTTLDVHGLYPGDQVTFKDAQANALTNNQTIALSSGNIDGASTFVLNQNNQSVTLEWNGANASVVSSTNAASIAPVNSGLFANKPASPSQGQQYFATDLGAAGILIIYSGAIWKPVGGVGVLYQNGVRTTMSTGDTSEHTAAEITIPAGLLSANGGVRIKALGAATGTAGTKTFRAYISSVSGSGGTSIFGAGDTAATLAANMERVIINRNSLSSQVTQNVNNNWSSSTTGANTTTTINTANAFYIRFTVQLADATDSIGYDAIQVEWLEA